MKLGNYTELLTDPVRVRVTYPVTIRMVYWSANFPARAQSSECFQGYRSFNSASVTAGATLCHSLLHSFPRRRLAAGLPVPVFYKLKASIIVRRNSLA